jgi:hypothetical protein
LEKGGVRLPCSSGGDCNWKGSGGRFPGECSREGIGGVPSMAGQKVGIGRMQTHKRLEGRKRLDGPWPKDSPYGNSMEDFFVHSTVAAIKDRSIWVPKG